MGAMTVRPPATDEAAIRQIIRALQESGYRLDCVYDGEETIACASIYEAMAAITAVDEAVLYVRDENRARQTGHVLFVLGNEPFEVVADYTANLSHVIDPITERWM